MQTSFDAGTPLIELTGNANDPLIDPNDDIPAVIVVNPNQTVEISVPRNLNANSVEHRSFRTSADQYLGFFLLR